MDRKELVWGRPVATSPGLSAYLAGKINPHGGKQNLITDLKAIARRAMEVGRLPDACLVEMELTHLKRMGDAKGGIP